jgi:hypothetical protein
MAIPIPVPMRIPFIGLPIAIPEAAPAMIAAIRKKPPAMGVRFAMRGPWQRSARRSSKNMVNDRLTSFMVHRERAPALTGPMDSPFIAGRTALAEAADLMERFGDDAGLEAAARAEQSRDCGNVIRFCHWRQIERVIATLSDEEVRGTVH